MRIDHLEEVIQKLCNDSGFEKDIALYVIETYLKQSSEILTDSFKDLNHAESNDYVKIEGLMHKLKGSSGNVRATKIMELAIEAENLAKEKQSVDLNNKLCEILSIINDYKTQMSGGI